MNQNLADIAKFCTEPNPYMKWDEGEYSLKNLVDDLVAVQKKHANDIKVYECKIEQLEEKITSMLMDYAVYKKHRNTLFERINNQSTYKIYYFGKTFVNWLKRVL